MAPSSQCLEMMAGTAAGESLIPAQEPHTSVWIIFESSSVIGTKKKNNFSHSNRPSINTKKLGQRNAENL